MEIRTNFYNLPFRDLGYLPYAFCLWNLQYFLRGFLQR